MNGFRCRLMAGLVVALLATTQDAHADKYAGEFMADGGGARALGMGSAFVAVADDASATFWNPAGLLSVESRQVLAMHSERFGDLVDRDFASYVHPLTPRNGERAALGFTIIRLGVDDIAFTEHLTPILDTNNDGTVDDVELLEIVRPDIQSQIRLESDQEWAFLGTYARDMGDWQLGLNAKFIVQSVGDYSAWGLGLDLGVLRRDWWRSLDVGLKLQDATSTYLSWSTGRNETIAPVVVPGVAYQWSFPDLSLDLTAAGALSMHFDNRGRRDDDNPGEGGVDQFGYQAFGGFFEDMTSNAFLGLEATLSQRAHLRLGSNSGFGSKYLTYGVGFELGQLGVDYALAGDVLEIDQRTHRVSLHYNF